VRGEPREPAARRPPRPPRLRRGAQRPLRRRPRLGPHPRRPPRQRPSVRPAGAQARFPRSPAPVPRRDRGARRGPDGRGPPSADRLAEPQPPLLAPLGAARPGRAEDPPVNLRALVVAAVMAIALLVPAGAHAHPLGNFSINHLTYVQISNDGIALRYILDQAEIPTFQERGEPRATVLAHKRDEVLRNLAVTVDGRRAPVRALPGASISFAPGQGGLRLTRVELPLAASAHDPRTVQVHDGT